MDPSFPTDSKAGQPVKKLVYPLELAPQLCYKYQSFPRLTQDWTVPKYHSTSIYTSTYIHSTVWECIAPGTSAEYGSTVGSLRVPRLEQVAHRFGSDKLYICLSNKCFKVYPVYLLCTGVRPSQDHWILRMQTVRINLAPLWGWRPLSCKSRDPSLVRNRIFPVADPG